MTLTSITAAVTGAYTLAKQIRRTWWHTAIEMMRGNLERKGHPDFVEKPNEKPIETRDDGPACGDV